MNSLTAEWNQAGVDALGFAGPAFLQSSLLILALGLADLALRRRLHPAVRYALWLLVPIKLLLPPGLALPTGLGYWLPRSAAPTAAALREFNVELSPEDTSLRALPAPAPAAQVHGQPVGRVRLETAGVLLAVWVAGTGVLLFGQGRRTVAAGRLLSRADSAPEPLAAQLNDLQRARGVRPMVGLALVDDLPCPLLFGLLRPRILLPRRLAGTLTPDQLRAVFLHELAHARRGDLWVNAAFCLLQAVWWWHPLVWFAHARLREVREEAVDAAVACDLGSAAETYPATLLEIARTSLAERLPGLGMLGILETRSALRARIERLLEQKPGQRAGLDWRGRTAALAIGLVTLPMAHGELRETAPVAAPTRGKTSTIERTESLEELQVKLKAARSELDTLRSRYHDRWPSVVEQRQRVEVLEARLSELGDPAARQQVRKRTEAQLLDARHYLDMLSDRDGTDAASVEAQRLRVIGLLKSMAELTEAQGTSAPPREVAEYVKTTPQGDAVYLMVDATTGPARLEEPTPWLTGDESDLRTQRYWIHLPAVIQALEQRTGRPLGDDGREWIAAFRAQVEAAGVHLDPPKALTWSMKRDDFVVRGTSNDLKRVEQVLGELALAVCPPRIQLEAQFFTVAPGKLASLGLRNASRPLGVLPEAQVRETLRRVARGDSQIKLLGGMRLITLTGRQGIISDNGSPTNQTPSLHLDAVPYLLKDGHTIRLYLGADFTEFATPEGGPIPRPAPAGQTDATADSGRTLAVNAISYITRHFTTNVEMPDGGAAVLGDVLDADAETRADGPGKTPVAILVTATLIDPAGNRIHPSAGTRP